jgi:hypothetical protein
MFQLKLDFYLSPKNALEHDVIYTLFPLFAKMR